MSIVFVIVELIPVPGCSPELGGPVGFVMNEAEAEERVRELNSRCGAIQYDYTEIGSM